LTLCDVITTTSMWQRQQLLQAWSKKWTASLH